jgi:hypothetical protein
MCRVRTLDNNTNRTQLQGGADSGGTQPKQHPHWSHNVPNRIGVNRRDAAATAATPVERTSLWPVSCVRTSPTCSTLCKRTILTEGDCDIIVFKMFSHFAKCEIQREFPSLGVDGWDRTRVDRVA